MLPKPIDYASPPPPGPRDQWYWVLGRALGSVVVGLGGGIVCAMLCALAMRGSENLIITLVMCIGAFFLGGLFAYEWFWRVTR